MKVQQRALTADSTNQKKKIHELEDRSFEIIQPEKKIRK